MKKQRIGNILVAATITLLVAVWTPTLLVGGLGVEALKDWVRAIGTARGALCPMFGSGCVQTDLEGVGLWALISASVVAALYFISGSLALRFRKETE